MADRPHHPMFAAGYDLATAPAERLWFRPHRRTLAEGLSGRVLDLGSGTGAMFPYYADGGADPEVLAVEPDPAMRRRARRRGAELDLDVAFIGGDATALGLADASVDAAVFSMVLCTVTDPAAAIDEAVRVLRPGGTVRVFEHVAADGWRRSVQGALAPAWRRVAGGCRLTRATGEALRRHPDLEVETLERIPIGVTPVRPFVRGRLRRRDAR